MDDVVAVAALDVVVAADVGDDVVAGAAEQEVVAVAALEPVVAAVALERVVALAGDDDVVAGGAAEHDVVLAGVLEVVGVRTSTGRRIGIVANYQRQRAGFVARPDRRGRPRPRPVNCFGRDRPRA